MKNQITIYRFPSFNQVSFHSGENWYRSRENWYHHRISGLTYTTELEGEAAAEEAFHLTNAPEECLTKDQRNLLAQINFKGPSLSVGNIVKVENVVTRKMPSYYLCKSVGWEKYSRNRIKLLKFLD